MCEERERERETAFMYTTFLDDDTEMRVEMRDPTRNSKTSRTWNKPGAIPNVTPIRVITAAMPSNTRYLNPHGSLVSRRRDLVKATQSIPGSWVLPVRRDPFRSIVYLVTRISRQRLPPGSSDWIISLHFDCLRYHRLLDCLRRSFLPRVTPAFISFDDDRLRLMASISTNYA